MDTVIVHHGRERERDRLSRLSDSVASGMLLRIGRFTGAEAHVYEGTVDEVYRLGSLPPVEPAPFPQGRPRRDPRWHYLSSGGDPELAADGDLDTAWEGPRPLIRDEFFRVDFGEPVPVSGIVLRLRRESFFPSQFRLVGRYRDGERLRLARFDTPQALQLIDALVEGPEEVSWGFDLGGRELTELHLLIGRGGTTWDRLPFPGWSIPEIEVWAP